jgi:hypothetical protein
MIYPDDEGRRYLPNVGKHLAVYRPLHPRDIILNHSHHTVNLKYSDILCPLSSIYLYREPLYAAALVRKPSNSDRKVTLLPFILTEVQGQRKVHLILR